MSEFWAGGGGWEGRLGPWSTLILDGLVFPGVISYDEPGACAVEIKGEVRYRIDSKKVKGHDGHKLTAEGYEPTKCVALVRMWRREQWDAFQAYLPTISPKIPRQRQKVVNGKPQVQTVTKKLLGLPSAPIVTNADGSTYRYPTGATTPVMESYRPSFEASHPWLAAYGIGRVYINEISFPEEADGRMVRVVKMSLWEVFEVKTSGKGSTSNTVKATGGPGVVDPFINGQLVDQPQGTVAAEPNHP